MLILLSKWSEITRKWIDFFNRLTEIYWFWLHADQLLCRRNTQVRCMVVTSFQLITINAHTTQVEIFTWQYCVWIKTNQIKMATPLVCPSPSLERFFFSVNLISVSNIWQFTAFYRESLNVQIPLDVSGIFQIYLLPLREKNYWTFQSRLHLFRMWQWSHQTGFLAIIFTVWLHEGVKCVIVCRWWCLSPYCHTIWKIGMRDT